jgi:hypothetical protein
VGAIALAHREEDEPLGQAGAGQSARLSVGSPEPPGVEPGPIPTAAHRV